MDTIGPILFLTTTTIITSILTYNKQRKTAKISELWIYPVKGCRGMCVKKAIVGKRGFLLDRLFMFIDKEAKFVSQRTQPKMALITQSVNVKNILVLSAPGMNDLEIDLNMRELCASGGGGGGGEGKEQVTSVINCFIWGEECSATIVPNAGEWFCKYLGCPSDDFRLVRMADSCVRPCDPKYAPSGQAAFSDGYPFLLASTQSLTQMNKKLKVPVKMMAFRPNIVCDSFSPFAEDRWDQIVFESCPPISMNIVKPCNRCKVPTIDPDTGIFDPNNEPTRTIKHFRSGGSLGFEKKDWKGEVFFGQNVDHCGQEGTVLTVGDTINIKSFQKW